MTVAAAPQPPPEAKTAPAAAPPRWGRRLRRLLGLGLLSGLALLAWILTTASGLRFALGLAEDLAPGRLRVGHAEGRLLGDWQLRDLALRLPALELDLGELRWRWSPWSALGGTLRIQEIGLREIRLLTRPGVPEATPPEPVFPLRLPEIRSPLAIELERLEVEGLEFIQPETAPRRLDRVRLGLSLHGQRATLRDGRLELPEPRLEAAASGWVDLAGGYPLELSLTWKLAQEPRLTLAGEARIGGDLRRLELEHRLSGAAEATLQAVVEEILDGPRWQAKLALAHLDPPAFQADLPAADLGGRLTSEGDLEAARIRGRISGEAPDLPDFGRLEADLDLLWRDRRLEIASLALTESRSGARLQAEGGLDLGAPPGRFEARATWNNLRWPLTGTLLAEAPEGTLEASGTFEAYRYRLQAKARGQDFPAVALRLSGEGDRQEARLASLELDTLGGRVAVTGRLGWQPQPVWDLKLTGKDLDTAGPWPEFPARLNLQLTSAGNLDHFTYVLEGEVQSPRAPAVTLDLAGQGDGRGTRIERLQIHTLDGQIQAQGEAVWKPQPGWRAEVTLADLNPGAHWPEWAGRLGGRLQSTGQRTAAGLEAEAEIAGFSGTLRGYPLKAEGRARVQGPAIALEQLALSSGPSRLAAEGRLEETLDLRFDLNSPDLRSLLPEAAGSFRIQGRVRGRPQTPAVQLELAAAGVQALGQGLRRLAGQADLDFSEGGRLRLDLDGEQLTAGGLAFDRLTVQGQGRLEEHQIQARLQGEPLDLEWRLGGGLDKDRTYRGTLRDFSATVGARLLVSPGSAKTLAPLRWRLQKPAPFAVAGEDLDAGPLCLREAGGSGGCAHFTQKHAGNWRTRLDVDQLAFALVAGWLPEDLSLDGHLGVEADFQAEGERLSGQAEVRIPRGLLHTVLGEGDPALDFSATTVRLEAGAGGLQAKIQAPLAPLGGIRGELALPGWSLADPARADQPLRGRLQGGLDDLTLIGRLFPDLTGVEGRVELALDLAGRLGRPGLQGRLGLVEGRLQMPLFGLEVRDLNLNAEALSLERIEYRGGFSAGAGRLELQGHSQWTAAGLKTLLEVEGENLTLADSREYFLLASPRFQIEAGSQGATVEGEVRVPEARIQPRRIPAGTVSPSPDVVVGTRAREPAAYPLRLDLRLVLGDQVKLNAFGLQARLAGDLRMFQEPGRELLGDGQLEVLDGRYRISTIGNLTAAIGKPLQVTQGLIVFAKTPLSNPGLVLTAKREGGDVTAGVRVFGTLRDPKLTFFSDSDPGMTQSEVTQYLITGIPPSGAKNGQSERGLSVGTYVAPKLFMEYENAMGDEQDKIKLRYEYNRWIEFQTETGDSQGADVFFKFER